MSAYDMRTRRLALLAVGLVLFALVLGTAIALAVAP